MTSIFVKKKDSERLYKLSEVDDEILEKLASKYSLDPAQQDGESADQLFLVIAIHAEDGRRKSGGKKEERLVTIEDMAQDIVEKGFRYTSKIHHPDHDGGNNQRQQLLSQAKEKLLEAICKWKPEIPDGSIIVDLNGFRRMGSKADDDDIPF